MSDISVTFTFLQTSQINVLWHKDAGYFCTECESCKEDTNHTKWMTFIDEPQVLMLYIKRFGNNGEKDLKEIEVPEWVLSLIGLSNLALYEHM